MNQIRSILAANVAELMKRAGTTTQDKAATKVNVAQSTIDRILGMTVGVRIDTLETVAKGFGKAPWQLLHPSLGETQKALMAYERARAALAVETPPPAPVMTREPALLKATKEHFLRKQKKVKKHA